MRRVGPQRTHAIEHLWKSRVVPTFWLALARTESTDVTGAVRTRLGRRVRGIRSLKLIR